MGSPQSSRPGPGLVLEALSALLLYMEPSSASLQVSLRLRTRTSGPPTSTWKSRMWSPFWSTWEWLKATECCPKLVRVPRVRFGADWRTGGPEQINNEMKE